MRKIGILLLGILCLLNMSMAQFITVDGPRFEKNGKPYYFLGTNFWYGLNLGSKGEGGDRQRLTRELDRLQKLGINNLRVMAASEGPDDQPWRMLPSLQPSLGVYNEDLLEGLDFLLVEMGKRDMHAVLCLNNFWPWSGGMAQYINWTENSEIPYPPPAEGGNWTTYQMFTTRFYKNDKAVAAYDSHVRKMVTRINSISGLAYKDDPVIMSWQLANEPRGILKPRKMRIWIRHTARLIKSLDPNHLVSVGSEGATSSKFAGTNFKKDHKKLVDYATFHLWVQNWGWYDPHKPKSYEGACRKAEEYIRNHVKKGKKLKMPIVLEEFGISRDDDNHDISGTTEYRDAYYRFIFGLVKQLAKEGTALVGCNFWAWGGEGRPREPHAVWKKGDDFIGDPPHEYQGWYSVYDEDISTHSVISSFAKQMNQLNEKRD